MRRILKNVGIAVASSVMLMAGCENQQSTKNTSMKSENTTANSDMRTTSMGWPTQSSGAGWTWNRMAFPTGDSRTSVVGIERGTPNELRSGAGFDYDIVVTNLTGNALEGVLVSETPSSNFKMTKSNPESTSGSGGAMTWAIGNMKPHETRTIKVSGSATGEGTVNSCCSVSYSSALCSSIPVVSPKLVLVKKGPEEVLKCEPITYTFEVTNTGTGTISDVKISDTLPEGLTMAGKNMIEIPVGALAAGQKRQFNATVNASKTGSFTNKAKAMGDGLTTESGEVMTKVHEPVLAIEKTCPGKTYSGRPLDYEIKVTNTGDGVAKATVIEDQLPGGATLVSASDGGRASGGMVTWNVGDLAPKASKTVSMQLRADNAGTYKNTATARATCAASVTDSCSTEITGIPAVLLEVIDVEDPDQVGTTETYVIRVTNQGTAPGTNIKIACTVEANQQYQSSSGVTTGSGSGSSVTFAALPTLAPKAVAEWKVIVKNVKAGDVRFKVSMTSDQLTRPVEETEATNVYE